MDNKSHSENSKYTFAEHNDTRAEICGKHRQFLCVLIGFIHYTNMGMLSSIGSMMISQLDDNEVLRFSPVEERWIMSIYLIPMAPVCILTGIIMQNKSKRYLLLVSCILEVIGWMINYFYGDTAVSLILAGRFIIGISCAIAAPIIPLYLAEVAPPKIRGFYISAVFMGLSVGIMLNNILGAFLSWKTCVLICIFSVTVNFIAICYLKESYVWHLKKNDGNSVSESFYWYRGTNEESKLEVSTYIEEHLAKNIEDVPEFKFFSDFMGNLKLLLLPLFVTVTLMTTMHLSGYHVIVFYSINIMKTVIPSLNVYVSTIIIDLIRLFASIVGCILIKKLPIRLLIMISGGGCALSHFLFCIFKYYSLSHVSSILSLLSVIMYIVFASIGLFSLPWVVCGEIFPLKVKNIACGISSFVFYGVFFLSIKFSPLLEINYGIIGEFVFYCCCTTIGTLIVYYLMPETRNKTLNEIENSIKSN